MLRTIETDPVPPALLSPYSPRIGGLLLGPHASPWADPSPSPETNGARGAQGDHHDAGAPTGLSGSSRRVVKGRHHVVDRWSDADYGVRSVGMLFLDIADPG